MVNNDLSELKGLVVKLVILMIVVMGMIGGCTYFNQKIGKANDWEGEEFLEEVLERKTGFKIDLTPSDPDGR